MAREQGGMEKFKEQLSYTFLREERIMQMLIRSVMLVIRRAMSVLASEDAVSKQAILPVAWVAAAMMAATVVLSMPDKAEAGTCWTAWGCNTQPAYWCSQFCNSDNSPCGDGWACVRWGSSPYYRCKCI